MKPGQFTLKYLFVETLWVAACLACLTQAMRFSPVPRLFLFMAGTLFAGGAIGGLFGRMATGFAATAWLMIAVAIVLCGLGALMILTNGFSGG